MMNQLAGAVGTILGSTVLLTVAAVEPSQASVDVMGVGAQLGNASSPVVLGVVCVALVVAVVHLFRLFTKSQERFSEKLEAIIAKDHEVMQHCRDKAK